MARVIPCSTRESAVGLAATTMSQPSRRSAPPAATGLRSLRNDPPCTVTKLGQNPLRQEKSLLQLDWSMLRLRPNSVSTGLTETQLDFSEQSPQPSHTASLMKTRFCGSG